MITLLFHCKKNNKEGLWKLFFEHICAGFESEFLRDLLGANGILRHKSVQLFSTATRFKEFFGFMLLFFALFIFIMQGVNSLKPGSSENILPRYAVFFSFHKAVSSFAAAWACGTQAAGFNSHILLIYFF